MVGVVVHAVAPGELVLVRIMARVLIRDPADRVRVQVGAARRRLGDPIQ